MSRNPLRACLVAVALAAGFLAQTDISATAAGKPVVFSFGWNKSGRTGQGTDEGNTLVATPIDTTNLMGKRIPEVATGEAHSLLVTQDGTVFSFGSNWGGATGLGTNIGNTLVAKSIDTTNLTGKTITQAAGGEAFSLLLADDGTVFSFGNNSYARTGLGFSNWQTDTLIPTPIDTTNLAGTAITQVATGAYHSLLLAEDDGVFAFGNNDWGQTGQGTSLNDTLVATPIDTTNLLDKTITQMAAGENHSLLLADDGTVFGFGSSEWGQAGLGPFTGTRVATPIDTTNLAGKTITQVAADRFHSLLLADDGTVFSMGMDSEGRTGLGLSASTATLVATPIDTSNLAGKTITKVAAGNRHSLLLADDGTVFSFGSNDHGQTGLGFASLADTLVATPIDMANLAGLRVTDIFADRWFSMLLAVPVSAPDFNNDGLIDCVDIDSLVVEIVAGTDNSDFDLTGDGLVNTADLDEWLVQGGAANLPSGNPYLVGDANLDGSVGGQDFIRWNANKFTSTAAWCGGDFNADGVVDGLDFVLWNDNKFTSSDGVSAVPEPSTVVVLFAAVLGLAVVRRR
jgi:alpha-tubulin suppressor-like RCC1 family protein